MYRHYRMINTETAPIEEAIPAKSEEEKEVGCLVWETVLLPPAYFFAKSNTGNQPSKRSAMI